MLIHNMIMKIYFIRLLKINLDLLTKSGSEKKSKPFDNFISRDIILKIITMKIELRNYKQK